MKLDDNDYIMASPATITRTQTRAAKLSKSGHVKVRGLLVFEDRTIKHVNILLKYGAFLMR